MAGIGAVSIHTGSAPRTERWCTRARGFRSYCFTAPSEAISKAADASLIWLDTAAVSRPPSWRVFKDAIFSSEVSRRAVSSAAKSPYATISLAKRPSSMAPTARWWLSSANRSMSSREMSHFSAIISAERNCDTSCVP